MHQEEKPAYIMAMAVCAMAEIAGMQAENQSRAQSGLPLIYGKAAFDDVIERHGIHHNAVLTLLRT